jgi:uncharacterized membrane protein
MMRACLIAGLLLLAAASPSDAAARPSFSCVFTEPFIGIDSYPGGLSYDTPEAVIAATPTTFTVSGETVTLGGNLLDGTSFTLTIRREPGSDGMSDDIYPYAGKLSGTTVNGELNGGCRKMPDGTSPRRVIKVAQDDVLNVRDKPNVKGKVVNQIAPGGVVWAYPEELVNGWARVAALWRSKSAPYAPPEIADGWVNAKFLGDVGEK